ncbi:MAG: hypothetical protein FWD17_13725, partial [Polyangiaceae bacterium]|nr:hypothetical protein [Polyangiaceae bacterium]
MGTNYFHNLHRVWDKDNNRWIIDTTPRNIENPYMMVLHNPEPTAIYARSGIDFSLQGGGGNFYEIKLRVQTFQIPVDNADLGATIKLTGTESGIF